MPALSPGFGIYIHWTSARPSAVTATSTPCARAHRSRALAQALLCELSTMRADTRADRHSIFSVAARLVMEPEDVAA